MPEPEETMHDVLMREPGDEFPKKKGYDYYPEAN
jgi:hypothetical protein